MMFKFSKQSLDKIEMLHPKLQLILNEAINYMDFTVLCTYRSAEDQKAAFDIGHSNAHVYGTSPHNYKPALAFDVAPYPINWDDTNRFFKLKEILFTIAQKHEIILNWGGTFSGKAAGDYGHFELANWKFERVTGQRN